METWTHAHEAEATDDKFEAEMTRLEAMTSEVMDLVAIGGDGRRIPMFEFAAPDR